MLLIFLSSPVTQTDSKAFTASNEVKVPSSFLAVKFSRLIHRRYKSRTMLLCFRNPSCSAEARIFDSSARLKSFPT